MKSQRVQLFHSLVVPNTASPGSVKVSTSGRLRNERGILESPAVLSFERDVASVTVETELSQVKATPYVIRAVLFTHEGSDGLVQQSSCPQLLRASACFALVAASVGCYVHLQNCDHFVSEAFT